MSNSTTPPEDRMEQEELDSLAMKMYGYIPRKYAGSWTEVKRVRKIIQQTQKDTIARVLELLPYEQNHASSSDPTQAEKTIAIYADGYNHYRGEIKNILTKELEK